MPTTTATTTALTLLIVTAFAAGLLASPTPALTRETHACADESSPAVGTGLRVVGVSCRDARRQMHHKGGFSCHGTGGVTGHCTWRGWTCSTTLLGQVTTQVSCRRQRAYARWDTVDTPGS